MTLLLTEVPAEALAQLKAGTQKSRFDSRNAQAKCLRSLFRGEIFNVAQRKDGAKTGRKTLNCLPEDLAKLGLIVVLLGIRPPFGEVAGNGSVFGLDVGVHGDSLTGLALAQPHKALIDRDANQPGRESGVSLKLVELLISLEKCVLRDVFGVFTVLSNMLRYPEDLALVLPDKLQEGSLISRF